MNINRGTGFCKAVYSIILIGTIIFSLVGGNLLSVHAQDTAPGSTIQSPPIPHPFTFHKSLCPADKRPGYARCNAEVVTDAIGAQITSYSLLTGSYGPAAYRGAYGVSGITATTRTVAIVDAYDNPTILNDLDAYSDNYGIPRLTRCAVNTGTAASPCIQKVNQTGGTTYPAYDSNWAGEIALDVEIVHALCQNCNILLIEASSNYDSDLITAANQLAYSMGANVVSNSWGGSESSSESIYDTTFNHPGVAYVFSTGDSGYGVQYPAASPYVTAVGGTSLYVNTDYTYNSESAWNGAGSGCSAYEAKPSFQHDASCTRRTVADVSADADPNTGAGVYITASGYSGWYQFGGTSLAAPLVAAVFALGGGVGTTSGNSLPYANLNYGVNLRDVTSGSTGSCSGSYLCTALAGYDGPTGLGTPRGTAAFTPGPNHTVTFNSNGGSGSMSNQVANVPTALTTNSFTRAGYSFSSWNTLANGSGSAYANGATYSFSADVILYAQWTALPNHTVTFNSNGGSGSMSNQVANIPTALTTNSFTRTGYSFNNWNTAANGSGTSYANGATYSFSADVTLYAQWTALPNHTVTFNSHGGSGSMSNQIANVPTALVLNTFTRSGYTFSGWNTAANGSGTFYANGSVYSFAADITLYAQWMSLTDHSVFLPIILH